MEKINLVWAIIWTVMFILCVLAFFWNPSHIFTAAISALFAWMFWHDYKKTKNL
jgi:hypothetical protein